MGAGGPTAAGRRHRESVRLQAAELSEQRIKPSERVRRLPVSLKSAYLRQQLRRDGPCSFSGQREDRRHAGLT